jgi:hypothetical protein
VWLLIIPAILLLDLFAIPNSLWQHSIVKRSIVGDPPRSTAHGRPLMAWPRRGEGGFDWVWPWMDGYEDMEASGWSGIGIFVDMPRITGTYHLTLYSREILVHGAERLLPADMEALHASLLHELRTEPEVAGTEYAAPIVDVLATGGWSTSRPINAGRRLDMAAAGLGAIWIMLVCAHGAHLGSRARRRCVARRVLTAA